jgi:hypothetical protein
MCSTTERKGCLFVHTAMQLATEDEELQGVLQKFMKRMAKAFSIGLESAKARGEVRKDLDTAAAGEFLTNTQFGLAVLGRTGFSRESLDGIVTSALASLEA